MSGTIQRDVVSSRANMSPSRRRSTVLANACEILIKRCIYSKLALKHFLKPGSNKKNLHSFLFESLSWLYQERKVVACLLVYLVVTLLVWQHHFYEKWLSNQQEISSGVNRYFLKLWASSVLYGSKHAILLQMAAIPLTMSRHLIAQLSRTFVQRIIPLEKMMDMHILLGYTVIALVLLATFLFLGFFGTLCQDEIVGREPLVDGRKAFCDKLTSEIMLTGLGITATMVLVGITSYLRSRVPYELFYYIHNLVFVTFVLAAAHTMDDKNREGQERSQDYKWFSASVAMYLVDRAFTTLNAQTMPVVEAKALGDNNAIGKVVILRVQKPIYFQFEPGQYVHLRIPEVDTTWHPFSIGSSTMEPTLDFYIEVMTDASWTGKLWNLIRNARRTFLVMEEQTSGFTVNVRGPYGVGFTDMSAYRHILLVGSGTGIVPMMSVLKTYYQKLYAINAQTHRSQVLDMIEISKDCFEAKQQRMYGMSLWDVVRKYFQKRADDLEYRSDLILYVLKLQQVYRLRSLRKFGEQGACYKALLSHQLRARQTESLKVGLLLIPTLECILCGLAISWHSLVKHEGHEIASMTEDVFCTLYWILLVGFVGFWCCSPMRTLFWCLDLVVIASTAVVNFTVLSKGRHFGSGEGDGLTVVIVLLSVYRLVRVWDHVVASTGGPLQKLLVQKQRDVLVSSPIDSIKLVWVSRGTSLPLYLWEDLNKHWSELNARYGKYTKHFSSIKIFVTCGERFYKMLQNVVKDTELFRNGTLEYGRPNMRGILQETVQNRLNESMESLVGGSIETVSNTLVAFCGSTALGNAMKTDVMDVVTAGKSIMGNSNHSLTVVQENFGVVLQKDPMKHASIRIRQFSGRLRKMVSTEANTAKCEDLQNISQINQSVHSENIEVLEIDPGESRKAFLVSEMHLHVTETAM